MTYEVKDGVVYKSKRSGIPFRVKEIARHAQDCSIEMVVYQNCVTTEDYPPFTTWVIEMSLFLKRFDEWG